MKVRASADRVLVISQLPPPVHGSTLMTKAFLDALDSLQVSWGLVDRRFSRSVQEIGRFNPGKVGSAAILLFRLMSALGRQRPRVTVFFATTRSYSFIIDWALSEVLRLFRAPVILYIHTVGFSALAERGKIWRFWVRRLLSSARSIVVLSESLSWDVVQFSTGNIEVITNTLPEAPDPAQHSVPVEKRNSVLFLSNLIPGKGYEDFLHTAIRLRAEGSKASFTLAGAADLETTNRVSEAITASGNDATITYVGSVDSDRKWQLFRSARAFVFPSTYEYESFALVLLEAIACGVPVVGYRTGALAPLVEEHGAGKFVNPGDRDALTAALREVLDSSETARRMGQAGVELYQSTLAADAYAESWRVVLERFGVRANSDRKEDA